MKNSLCLIALVGLVIAPSAQALSPSEVRECKSLSESFPARTAEVKKAVAERDSLAETAESAGEAWENAENVRNLSAERALEADQARQSFDEAKAQFYAAEAEAHSLAQALNQSLSIFNAKCVSD